MQRIFLLILAIAAMMPAVAAKFSYRFHNVPVAQALVQIARENPDLKINFIYNELNNYKVSATIDTDNPETMIRHIIGMNPISLTASNGNYYIEALQHGKFCYRGRVVDAKGEPLPGTTIKLLAHKDSTVITYAVADETGNFTIPCDSRKVIAKLSSLGYKTIYHNFSSFNVGNIVMPFDAVALKQVTVDGQLAAAYSDRTVYIPTSRQKRTAQDAVDLLMRMAIPQINVDPISKKVTDNSGMDVVIYINGMKAEKDELKGMRTTDAKRVEYLESPTDARYKGAMRVINIYTQQYEYGGYTKLSAQEDAIAVFSNTTNIFSTFSYKKMKYDLFVEGENKDNRHNGATADTRYSLTDSEGNPYEMHRIETLDDSHSKSLKYPVTFRASYNNDKMYSRNTFGFTHSATTKNWQSGGLTYNPSNGTEYTYESNNPSRSNLLSYKGDLYFSLPKDFSINITPNISYLHTNDTRDYKPSDSSPIYRKANEDVADLALDFILSKSFGKGHTLLFNTQGRCITNHLDYTGTDNYTDKFKVYFTYGLIRYILKANKLRIWTDAGIGYENSDINGVKDKTQYFAAHFESQYNINKKNKLNIFIQYAAYTPSISQKSSAVLKNNDYFYITGNPLLHSTPFMQIYPNYTWLPTKKFRMSIYGGYDCIIDHIATIYEPYKDGTAILRRMENKGKQMSGYMGANIQLKLLNNKLQLSVRPEWTIRHVSEPYNKTQSSLHFNTQAYYYTGPFYFSAYYGSSAKRMEGTTLEKTSYRSSHFLSAGWAYNNLNIRFTAHNIFNKGWKGDTTVLDTPYYGYEKTSYSPKYHARLNLSVTYTFGYGKKVKRNNEIGEQAETQSAILK